MHRRVWYALIVVLGLVFMQATAPLSAESNSRYFSPTGHNVQGAFLDYFDSHGGLDLFGYPLTEQFYNERQVLVQFFQRAMMEYRPTNPAPYKIQLALLGVLLGRAEPAIAEVDIPRASDTQRRYIAQTGHTVSFAFLNFYDKYGGAASFGYPITELKIEKGRIVQYFQRGRMEWHPENPSRYKVQLGLLGSEYADALDLSLNLLSRTQPINIIPTPTARPPANIVPAPTVVPVCSAAVKYRVTGLRGTQTVSVRCTDKNTSRGLPNVDVVLTVRFPDGTQIFNAKTDAAGSASLPFDIGSQQPGIIIIVEAGFAQNGSRLSDPVKTYFLAWSTN